MAIPSPKQLAAFAASAKTLNFTKAAADLGVQQPAVSRHILGLEQILGVRLFVRTKPKLTLTSRGRALSAVVMASFEAIYAATDKISNPVNSVSVGFSDDIASHYLAPLLSGFQANNPDIALQITERDPSQSTPISDGDVTFAIAYRSDLPAGKNTELFKETLIAIASATSPYSLPVWPFKMSRQPLLHLDQKGLNLWQAWFEGRKAQPADPAPKFRFSNAGQYLQAVKSGQGVAIGWQHLTDEHVLNGDMVEVGRHRVTTDRGFFVCLSNAGQNNPSAREFFAWASKALAPSAEQELPPPTG